MGEHVSVAFEKSLKHLKHKLNPQGLALRELEERVVGSDFRGLHLNIKVVLIDSGAPARNQGQVSALGEQAIT